jgi:hypothetical protein
VLGATSVEIVGEQFFVSSPPEYPMLCHAPQAELFDVCAPLGISLGSVLLFEICCPEIVERAAIELWIVPANRSMV